MLGLGFMRYFSLTSFFVQDNKHTERGSEGVIDGWKER